VLEATEIIEPFTIKHLEGDYSGTEEILSEEWHYSGPITESHCTTWPYESTSIRPTWAIVKTLKRISSTFKLKMSILRILILMRTSNWIAR
jgi:hypothetical protein